MPGEAHSARRKKDRLCPICGKPAVDAFRPFCSRGCKAVDLNRWLSGTYVIAAPGEGEDETDAPLAPAKPRGGGEEP